MSDTDIRQFLTRHRCILGEGAVIERLRRSGLELDSHVVNSAFIYEGMKRSAIETIYRQYLDIGSQFDLPMVLSTPTWRAGRQRIEAAGFGNRDLNGDNFRFLNDLRRSYGQYAKNVMICGLMSCHGDAYNPAQALSAGDAHRFHAWQAGKLADAGVDFILAATLPALSEAIGLASALAETGIPYVVSFVVRPEATLLDGTPLNSAFTEIDGSLNPPPIGFMANCTHASFVRSALQHKDHSSTMVRKRLIGLFANTAALTPEELDNSESLVEEDPESFGRRVAALHREFGLKVLGGCCGTDDRHIRSLAASLVREKQTISSPESDIDGNGI
jgi:S-methylmethionine-dependent homocysteine/selenocysteine methylase